MSKETITIYTYGMRLRGFAPLCQPMDGLVMIAEDGAFHKYHDLLNYNRKLTDDEVKQYDLDYIGEGKMLKGYAEVNIKSESLKGGE